MRQYIALIHKDPDSDYGVSFPDLPGVATAGSTLDEARAMLDRDEIGSASGIVALQWLLLNRDAVRARWA